MSKPYFEHRIGLVMYGGVSLAIYMNGIAQEFLNLVLSTATDDAGDPVFKLVPDAANSDEVLQGTPVVYRQMAELIRESDGLYPKFVVDILSGTSAGGLNGMFLAKALAEKKSILPLSKLWIEEGEIERLLDREESYADLPPLPRRPSRSLLNSRRMYAKLLGALEQMDQTSLFKGAGADLVKELDLHMTATDLVGRPVPVNLGTEDFIPRISGSDGQDREARRFQLEKEHRTAFHFRYAPDEADPRDNGGGARNDFKPTVNPFLAFVGRCTSSIVPAFEPMRLKDALDVLDQFGHPHRNVDWKQHYSQFWRGAQFLSPANDDARSNVTRDAEASFKMRPFGDGGYLDNKPFGHAFTSLKQRRALVPVRRMVFYVEPHPERNGDISQSMVVPEHPVSAVRHAQLAMSLGKAQNIYERVREMRKLADHSERVRRALSTHANGEVPQPPPIDLYYESTLDQLATILSDLLGFGDDDSLVPALRSMVAVSLRIAYEADRLDADPNYLPEPDETFDFDAFHKWAHDHFDLAYSNRIFEFIRAEIESKALKAARAPADKGDDSSPPKSLSDEKKLSSDKSSLGYDEAVEKVSDLYSEFRAQAGSTPKADAAPMAKSDGLDTTWARPEDSFARMRTALDDCRLDPQRRNAIFASLDDNQRTVLVCLLELRVSVSELSYVQVRTSDDRSNANLPTSIKRARLVLRDGIPDADLTDNAFRTKRPKLLVDLLRALRRIMSLEQKKGAYQRKISGLNDPDITFDKFEQHDARMFPLLYQAGMADSYALDLVRISPMDARALTKDVPNPVEKLSGIGLGHFAAFLTRPGRILDIVWGRLDAAEIILRTYLPRDQADKLLPQAQIAIIGSALEELRGQRKTTDGREPLPEESNDRAIERLEELAKVVFADSGGATV